MSLPLLIHAANIGFMLMFYCCRCSCSLLSFISKAAASYLRVLFPRLFMFGFTTSSIATISSLFDSGTQIIGISAVIAFGFLFNALILTPKNQSISRQIYHR